MLSTMWCHIAVGADVEASILIYFDFGLVRVQKSTISVPSWLSPSMSY